MNGQAQPISPQLYARLGTALAPVLLDVRRQEAFVGHDRLIVGAFRRSLQDVEHWHSELPAGFPTQLKLIA